MQFMRRKALALAIAALPFAAHANPQGGQIVAGSATIRQETQAKLGITQTSDKAIIDWKSFSIGKNEHTQFYQPAANSVTLNRVVGEDPSQILGRLTANGRVFLVNPNGIFFGKDAQIDVAALVASTHNIRNEDFLAGRYNFNIPGKPGAAVINEGTIRIADTGIAAFVAPSVANRGIIAARLGKVVLAAANGFTLDFYGDNLVSFFVADEVAQTAFDIEGKQLTSFVENSGRIEAQGGYVLLTARAAEGVVQSVINQSGSIEATTVGTHKGEIILNAGKGSLAVAGSLDASAPDGGDGGFIETSGGYVAIDPATRITTAAPFGSTGRWLIDPTDYIVAANGGNITGATLAGYLTGNNVEIQTLTTGSGNGDIFVNDAVTWNTTNKLTLTAYRDININQHINAAGGGSIKLRADSTARGSGTVAFGGSGRITVNNGASVGIYYNPASYTDTATRSDTTGNPYGSKVTRNTGSTFIAYMLINDVNQLQAMKDRPTGFYALGKDVDASATAGWNGGKGFIPVGDSATTFSGRFSGDDHAITNLFINDPARAFAGLFGVIGAFGKVYHVGLLSAAITGIGDAGILAGRNYGSVTNTYGVGDVLGFGAGGLVGRNWGTISRSFSGGTVTAVSGGNAGGLASINGAYSGGGVISDSFTTSQVTAPLGFSGGLVCLSETGTTVTNSYATGQTTTPGQLFNFPSGLAQQSLGTVTSSYWNTETTGQSGSAAGTGKTTAQMKQQTTFSGWDFTNVWRINEGTSYPYLAWTASTTVEARQLLQPSGSASSVGSSVGATTKVVTDICSVAPIVCRPELAPIPPKVEIPKANSGSVPDSPGSTYGVTETYKFSQHQLQALLDIQVLPQFSYALGPEGLVLEKLTETDKTRLMSLLISNGIPVNFNKFGEVGSDLKQKSLAHQEKWSKLMQDALDKVSDAGGLSTYDIAELAGYTVINTATGVADAISLGVATGGTKIPTTIAKLKKWNGFKSVKSYSRSVGNLQDALDSPLTKILSLVVENGFTVTDEVMGLVNNDKSLADQLKEAGVEITDFKVGKKIEASKLGNLSGIAYGKLAQAIAAIGGDLLSNQITGNKTEIMDLLSTAAEFIPIAGPMISQYKKAEEISSRISPEAKTAWDNYQNLQQQYRIGTDKLNHEIMDKKLEVILSSPYSSS